MVGVGVAAETVAMPIGCLVAPPLHIAKVHAYSHPSVGQQVRINVVWKEMGRMCNSVVKTNVPLPLIIMGQPLAKGWGGIEPTMCVWDRHHQL